MLKNMEFDLMPDNLFYICNLFHLMLKELKSSKYISV